MASSRGALKPGNGDKPQSGAPTCSRLLTSGVRGRSKNGSLEPWLGAKPTASRRSEIASFPAWNVFCLALLTVAGSACGQELVPPLDRHALVSRHNLEWNDVRGQIPLGNGEFCFNADATGLQTFGGNTMAHWGWHSFPLTEGWTPDRVPPTGTFQQGRLTGGDNFPAGAEALRTWMFDNPHRLNLARFRFRRGDRDGLTPGEITHLSRQLDLWAGLQTSHFELDGHPVNVQTCVHPTLDAVAVQVESPLLDSGELSVAVDFPYPSLHDTGWVGDFSRDEAHTTRPSRGPGNRADFERQVDGARHRVAIAWSAGGGLTGVTSGASRAEVSAGQTPGLAARERRHRYVLSARGTNVLEFVCAFASSNAVPDLQSFRQTRSACVARWNSFWRTGGAIESLSESRPTLARVGTAHRPLAIPHGRPVRREFPARGDRVDGD